MARDLGADATVIDGACDGGWAMVDLCSDEPCGDTWVLARVDGGVWSVVTGFPATLCRSELETMGTPGNVLDVVHWPPTCSRPTSTAAATPRPADILGVFIAAWDRGDWDDMATVAEPGVVQFARASTVPEGLVLPPPPRGRCFAFADHSSCEVAYGTGDSSVLYVLRVTDRVVDMAPSD